MILKTELFKHQQEANNFIFNLNYFALYMEMGTGKTRTILEFIKNKNIETVFYFCPVCLKKTVELELKKHIYNPNYFIENGQKFIPFGFHFYIIGIESINSNRVYFAIRNLIEKIKCQYAFIIDESSFIKSFCAKRTHKIIEISRRAEYRIIMTGTPITQYYQDLYMQFRFLNENIIKYRSYQGFCSRYLIYHEKFSNFVIGAQNTDELLKQVSPYIYQIKKSECLDLPKKLYKNYYYELSVNARQLYNKTKNKFIENIDDFYQSKDYYRISLEIFKLYLQLQKIVSYDSENRITLFKEIISNLDKVCVICKFIKEIELIKDNYKEAVVYTGKETLKQRSLILESIDNVKMLLMTFGVGSHGLNLTPFNICIYYSNIFKFGERLQSEDRFHRIGQNKNVLYINIICNGTIDEIIQDNLRKKDSIRNLFEDEIRKVRSKKDLINLVKSF